MVTLLVTLMSDSGDSNELNIYYSRFWYGRRVVNSDAVDSDVVDSIGRFDVVDSVCGWLNKDDSEIDKIL
jgi:hypothetical protein